MSIEPKATQDQPSSLSEEELAFWKNYTDSLTEDDFQQMRQVTDVDVLAKLNAHIQALQQAQDD